MPASRTDFDVSRLDGGLAAESRALADRLGPFESEREASGGRFERTMIRFLILIIAVYVLYRLIFVPSNAFFFSASRPKPKKPRHPDAEEMVPCANCGTFIAKREAEVRGGRFYCRPKCHA